MQRRPRFQRLRKSPQEPRNFSQTPHKPSKKLNIGEILSASFKLSFQHFLSFLAMGIISFIPLILLAALTVGGLFPFIQPGQQEISLALLLFVIAAIFLFFFGGGYFVTAAISHATYDILQSKNFQLSKSLQQAFSAFFTILVAASLCGLIITCGYFFFIIPGIIFACRYYIVVPTIVVEKLGALAAMRRSKQLTDGYKGYIFGVIFFLGLIQQVVTKILGAFLEGGLSREAATIVAIFFALVSLFFYIVSAVASAMIYYELRRIKEGIDLKDLLRTFE